MGLAGSVPLALLQMGADPGSISDLMTPFAANISSQAQHRAIDQNLDTGYQHMDSRTSIPQADNLSDDMHKGAAVRKSSLASNAGIKAATASGLERLLASAGLEQEASSLHPAGFEQSQGHAEQKGPQKQSRAEPAQIMDEADLANLSLLALQVPPPQGIPSI